MGCEKCFVTKHFVALLQGCGFSDLRRLALGHWDLHSQCRRSSETERAEHYLRGAAVEIPLVHSRTGAAEANVKQPRVKLPQSPGSVVQALLPDALVGYRSGHRGAV